mgnify:CR=1 FL=1
MEAVIIDDDSTARDTLKTLISIYAPTITIIGEANGVKTGIELIKNSSPELVLLDVEMQDGTGFDLLSIIGNPTFKVIFVTGHDAFAIKAFKYSAIDYVLKPLDPDDLVKALEKAANNTSVPEEQLKITTLAHNATAKSENQKIVLRDATSIYLVAINEIIRCEAEANYTTFYIKDGRKLIVSKTLKEYDTLLNAHHFFRIHQSHLINLNYFDRFDKANGGVTIMKDGSILPVAVRKKEQLITSLNNL